ncbi:hypothetical protein [Arthrobacter sp. JSM 101049]|uniref:hypothetical protein n=1 Tax=Arthrobacter sp. JSM 101049 TaxID=929097 RepID=UPI003569F971
MSYPNAPADPSDAGAPGPGRPLSIVVVSVLLLLEALATLGAAVWYATSLVADGPVSLGGRIFMLVLIIAASIWQANVAFQVFRGHAWTRAAAIVWQVFQVIFAVSFLGAGGWALALGIALLVPAAAIIILTFDPRATAFFGDREPRA